VLRLSHRVVVLRDRHVVADLENDGLTVDALLALIADGSVETDELAMTDATTPPDAAALAVPAAPVPGAAAAASAPDPTTDHDSGGRR
jgi:galactofuranose transport system ATP-binding protein